MKKAIIFIFLVFADIALLAHAVVPHHHHGKTIVYFFHVHFTDCEKAHHHCASESGDQGEKGDSDNCPINDIYIRIDSDKEAYADYSGYMPAFDCISSFHVASVFNVTDYGYLPFRQKPHLYSYYTVFISEALGLRAPPVF